MFRAPVSLIALALLTLGCASDSTGPNTDTPAIGLTLSPTSAQIQPGGSTQLTATLSRTNFTGAITVVVEGAPNGVTGTATVNATGALVSLSATSGAATGVYTLTVRASGSGVTAVTKTFALTIITVSNSYFTLSLGNAYPTIVAGNSATSSITISRTGFSGAISFSVDGAPDYMTATVAPVSTTGATATLTIDTTNRLVSGIYYLLVRGSSAGQADVAMPVTVTVP